MSCHRQVNMCSPSLIDHSKLLCWVLWPSRHNICAAQLTDQMKPQILEIISYLFFPVTIVNQCLLDRRIFCYSCPFDLWIIGFHALPILLANMMKAYCLHPGITVPITSFFIFIIFFNLVTELLLMPYWLLLQLELAINIDCMYFWCMTCYCNYSVKQNKN